MANAFRQKLRKWPRIQNDDFVGLRKFSDYLCQVETAKLRNKSLFVLDDEQENRSLLFKIPSFCHSRWSRKVAQNIEDGHSYPTFSEFCKFIRIEAAVVNNPVTCIKSQSQSGSNHGYRAQQGGQSQGYHQQSFANRPRFSHAVTSPPAFNQGSISCFYCNQSHFLSDCHGFISLSLDERRNFCKSQRLCFGCLRHGHSNRDCRKRMQCATCNRHHPTVLHDDNWQAKRNYSQVTPLMPPLQPDRPPQSYFEASCPVQFQNTNKGVGSPRQIGRAHV